jgi:hypothetical protein
VALKILGVQRRFQGWRGARTEPLLHRTGLGDRKNFEFNGAAAALLHRALDRGAEQRLMSAAIDAGGGHHHGQIGEIPRAVAERADLQTPRAPLRRVQAAPEGVAVAFARAGAFAVAAGRTGNKIVLERATPLPCLRASADDRLSFHACIKRASTRFDSLNVWSYGTRAFNSGAIHLPRSKS